MKWRESATQEEEEEERRRRISCQNVRREKWQVKLNNQVMSKRMDRDTMDWYVALVLKWKEKLTLMMMQLTSFSHGGHGEGARPLISHWFHWFLASVLTFLGFCRLKMGSGSLFARINRSLFLAFFAMASYWLGAQVYPLLAIMGTALTGITAFCLYALTKNDVM